MASWKHYQHMCPLCGKVKDTFCGWDYSSTTGLPVNYCGRVHGSKSGEEFSGHDGNSYIFIKTTKAGYSMYQEKGIVLESRRKKYGNDYSIKSDRSSTAPVRVNPCQEYTVVDDGTDIADPKRLNEVYSAILRHLTLEKKDELALREEWGDKVFNAIHGMYPIKTLPVDDWSRKKGNIVYQSSPTRRELWKMVIEEVGEPFHIPGLFQREWTSKIDGKMYRTWDSDKKGGVLFPEYDSDHNIVRLRIKDAVASVKGAYKDVDGEFSFRSGTWVFTPNSQKNGQGTVVYDGSKSCAIDMDYSGIVPRPRGKVEGKYKNFSSYREKRDDTRKEISNWYLNGTQSGSKISVYDRAPKTDYRLVFVTEGEKKGMVGNLFSNFPFVHIPGVLNYPKLWEKEEGKETSMWDFLVSKGMKCLVVAYDADKSTNEMVMRAEDRIAEMALEHGIKDGVEIYIADWRLQFAKGIDDLYVMGGKPTFKQVIKK